MRDLDSTASIVESLRELAQALNPVRMWEVLREAEEGVCLMVPVPVKQRPRRR